MKKHSPYEATLSENLRENEKSANKQMVLACAVTSIIIITVFILYCTRVFPLRDYTLVYIFMPINIVALLVPLPLSKRTNVLERPWFKYLLMSLFLYVVSTVNIVVPKHGILGWAVPIILANHFYSRKFGTFTFLSCIALMLPCMYLGMLVGEYDPALLTEGVVVDGVITLPATVDERLAMLNDHLQNGDNRWLKVFAFYYLPRSAIMAIIFFISQALNKRTFLLLKKEGEISSMKERMENELKIASEIQAAALPHNHFKSEAIEISAALLPAREIGGDLYDYFFLDKHHLAFLIGDVSGKGAPAALFMMKALTCFKNVAALDKPLLDTMLEVNKRLIEGNTGEMFVTAFFGVLDTRNGEIRYVNAGHCPPLVSSKGKFSYIDCNPGFVLGALDDILLKEESLILEPGAMMLCYTDGITEAQNRQGVFYGKNRLLRACNFQPYSNILELAREAQDDLFSFMDGTEQADDLTALAIHYLYEDAHIEELHQECTLKNVTKAISFFSNAAKKDSLPKPLIKSLSIVVDEIYSNIAKYAYGENGGDVFMRYCYYVDEKKVKLTFIDRGIPYDPTKKKGKAKVELEGKEGGLGLLIVRNIMDDVDYDYRNGKNFLVLTKRIQDE